MDDAAIARRKVEARARLRAVRAAIPAADRPRRAEAMQARLFDLPPVASARRVLLFYAFGSEIPTTGLAAAFRRRGAEVLLPVVRGDRMDAVVWADGASLERSALGTMEPSGGEPADPLTIDLVVAPGLGFDTSGHRLGYGGGFYDRFLEGMGPSALRAGIGFDEQLVEDLPHDERDIRLDVVVTDARTVWTST